MRRRALLSGMAALVAGPAFALYDAKPEQSLAAVQGEWHGSLTYKDYGNPRQVVTLPTRLYVALGAPVELVLHYVFDDGPSKTVHSYERMTFDFPGGKVRWVTGEVAKVADCAIVSDVTSDPGRTLVFERSDEGRVKRFTMVLASGSLQLGEEEVGPDGGASFRNRYAFARPR
jgi:hypothetical protein